MKRSEIYREAARIVDKENQYSCCAIEAANGTLDDSFFSDDAREYQALFKPDGYVGVLWGQQWGDISECHACRVLALCFMAAISEDDNG